LEHTHVDEKRYQLEIEREFVAATLIAYIHAWESAEPKLETLASEFNFQIPISNPDTTGKSRTFTLCGKIDRIVRDKITGLTQIHELKTTSEDISGTGDYWLQLHIALQPSLYLLAAQQLGKWDDIFTILFDVIKKPLLRPLTLPQVDKDGLKIVLDADGNRVLKKDGAPRTTSDTAHGYKMLTRIERPEEFGERVKMAFLKSDLPMFRREEVVRLPNDMEETRYALWQMAAILRENDIAGRWPRNDGRCTTYGRCPYFALCTGSYDIRSQEVPPGFILVNDTHPELTEED